MDGHQQVPTFAVLPPPAHQQQAQQQQHYAMQAAPPPTPQPQPLQHKYSSTAWNLARKAHLDNRMLTTKTTDVETEDGRISNVEAAEKIKDAWMYKQIRARRDEFTHYRQAMLFIGSWNVNAKGKEESLDSWICADWGPNGEYAPDLVAVGFQEIVDLNAVNVAVDNKTQQRSQFWVERLMATLNSPHNTRNDPNRQYFLLQQKSMVGLLVCVFCKAPHKDRVRYINSTAVGVGVMGMLGNKGGVAVRVQFYDSTLCFLCTHLAAHRENVTGRNQDFANVFNKSLFEIGEEATREAIYSGSMSHWEIGATSVNVIDHDLIFWLGDLNYRIDESMPTDKVLEYAETGKFAEMRKLDQLNVERAHGRAFEGFEEGVIQFPPTYKYQPGTDGYDKRPEKKLRAPAWCDRILWMALEPAHVQQLTYNRSEQPNVSDHKAVYSTMKITIKDVVRPKRAAIHNELMKLLDRFENQTLPMVGLDRVNLDFGEIHYDRSKSMPIQITNTGNVVAKYRFVPKLDENTLCKPWIKVEPPYGLIIPGDQPATINVTITVDRHTAQLLNQGREVLDDILILRLENGRDYYITIKAAYARSCFGMSVDELVMYSDPIRNVPLDPIKRAEKYDPNPSNALCVPKELWRLIDAIFEKGLQEPDLFVDPGDPEDVKKIRECLDTGAPFGQYKTLSYAEALLEFFSSLSIPIVPPTLFPTLEIDSQNIQSSARRFLEELPPVHYNVLLYVISFFREALVYRERNRLTAAKLARICSNHMAPPSSGMDDSTAAQRRSGMQLIMVHLLETNSI
ncbi:II inositol 1,4,5-trisphosphate 5-phosphatase [Seminavis robusta]|uniref:II inositol 1,4,5-trisphosphate 5-phosphatase n=1 Tax=Seminavis robusta TaxID=568900 RepID=A0A9N8EPY2_9STRA|nr:II inositol 1,4,5-trisphosphate 5-phosphatase [Seminavis robusta]|eukprot:Sro1631_g287220.1 II inositol 1,4,5-trisphosphate 5-phosphatase (794) ;mRNA; f:434-3266